MGWWKERVWGVFVGVGKLEVVQSSWWLCRGYGRSNGHKGHCNGLSDGCIQRR